MNYEEDRIQAAIVQALSLLGVYFFYVPNSEAGAVSAAKASRLKAMGLRSGVSDLVLIGIDGRAYFLEIKTATGKLSESQKKFQALCQAKNWPYAVARSVDEAVTKAREWGLCA
ncbi:MAG TPA: VRR-NUC domain-containing protein [Spirochaetales bacterium]|nr:VRR-NUC domain-containing protein [Spirochaetales bacterium]